MAGQQQVVEARGSDHIRELASSSPCVVLHFRAHWCDASRDMDAALKQLVPAAAAARIVEVEAENHPDVAEAYNVSAVPYFVFLKDGQVVDKLQGANPAELAKKIDKLLGDAAELPEKKAVNENGTKAAENNGATAESILNAKLEKLLRSKPLMLFMKGSPEEPRCGFSRNVVELLKAEGAEFGSFDILQDEEVRQGLKKYSNWPTYPQLYYKGELLGGCDVLSEMQKNGELSEIAAEVKAETSKGDENSKLKKLITSSEVMLFMKGTPEEPKCGFSRKVVEALRGEGVSFGSFDILSDEEVRQGLKAYSNWPTYPQLYSKGELLGGCDIVMELKANGELKEALL